MLLTEVCYKVYQVVQKKIINMVCIHSIAYAMFVCNVCTDTHTINANTNMHRLYTLHIHMYISKSKHFTQVSVKMWDWEVLCLESFYN